MIIRLGSLKNFLLGGHKLGPEEDFFPAMLFGWQDLLRLKVGSSSRDRT